MNKLILFTGTDCHLCDLAKQLLCDFGVELSDLKEINVKQEREYFHQYGARIPVLKCAGSDNELAWPFDQEQLKEFLS